MVTVDALGRPARFLFMFCFEFLLERDMVDGQSHRKEVALFFTPATECIPHQSVHTTPVIDTSN